MKLDRDTLLEELEENRDLTQRARFKLEDINHNLPIDKWEFIHMHIANARTSLEIAQREYEKEIEKLGGNY